MAVYLHHDATYLKTFKQTLISKGGSKKQLDIITINSLSHNQVIEVVHKVMHSGRYGKGMKKETIFKHENMFFHAIGFLSGNLAEDLSYDVTPFLDGKPSKVLNASYYRRKILDGGLTNKALGDKFGWSPQHISNVKCNVYRMVYETIAGLTTFQKLKLILLK